MRRGMPSADRQPLIDILTSERADIDDVRVRELAEGIARTQRKEITEMDWLIEDIERNGPATTGQEARQRPIPDSEGQAAGVKETESELPATALRLLGIAPSPAAARP